MKIRAVNLRDDPGLKGLSGKSADLRELLKAEKEGDQDSKTAVEILAYKIQKYIHLFFKGEKLLIYLIN